MRKEQIERQQLKDKQFKEAIAPKSLDIIKDDMDEIDHIKSPRREESFRKLSEALKRKEMLNGWKERDRRRKNRSMMT